MRMVHGPLNFVRKTLILVLFGSKVFGPFVDASSTLRTHIQRSAVLVDAMVTFIPKIEYNVINVWVLVVCL